MEAYEIALTTYNDAQSIEAFLLNITNQSLPPKRIIMADGGSSDETIQLAKGFQEKSACPVTIIRGKRLNYPQGINTAIKATEAPYIGIVAVGNLYDKYHFERLMARAIDTNADIAYPYMYGQDTTAFSKWYNQFVLNGNQGFVGESPSNHGALLKRSVFQRIGYFIEDLSVGEDTEFYLRAMRRGITVQAVNEAEVYWETPKSIREYLKQVNWYTIGNMRVFSNRKIMWRRKSSILLWLVTLLLILSTLLTQSVLDTLGLIVAFVLICALRFQRFGWKGAFLCLFSKYLPVFYMLKNCRYFCSNRKVCEY